jgi:GWxTD domain-containing protein
MLFATVFALAIALGAARSALQVPADWADSAEASFLTSQERREWKRLKTDDAREAFVRDYWRRRDPSADTEPNEFQEQVFARIRDADERFSSRNQPGSRTARGAVFVVMGAPSLVRATSGPLDSAPRQELPGVVTLPRGALDSNGWEEWVYDREHHAAVLKTLSLPVVELSFIVERGRDQLQRPGVFGAYRETIARSTILRP